ncbi:hypothetical protein CU048_13730 [Beijerinckiaceae bacterium]|nr:hypothetical protein CU048_13730 [Beijerinckiaceae bacterium]
MARAIQKHIARRQDVTFADWFAELRELAGDRWPTSRIKHRPSTRYGAAARRRSKRFTWLA